MGQRGSRRQFHSTTTCSPILLLAVLAGLALAYGPYATHSEAHDPAHASVSDEYNQVSAWVVAAWIGSFGSIVALGIFQTMLRQRANNRLGIGRIKILESALQTAPLAHWAIDRQGILVVENLIQAAPAMVLVLDPGGHVLRSNPYVEKVTGYSQEALEGRDALAALIPEADRPAVCALVAQLIDSREVRTVTGPIVTQDGERRQIEWNLRALHDSQGKTLGVLAVGHDITALHEAQTRAVQAERLAAIGEMVTGLAHESGNALQRIQACLEMLALQVQDRPAALDLVYRIQIAQDHLHQLYEEVRQYAAPIVLRREPAHVSDVLLQAWEHLEPVRAGRVVEFINREGSCVCRVDRYAMERVFRNILENALAAAADPVRIEILWNDTNLGERPAVEVRLRDNGPGLNGEQKKHIFEPFYTTKTQSTGLGMAIAKRLVEAHGGQIGVGDRAAAGAEIVVTLPKE